MQPWALGGAGIVAGVLNSVAGAGSLITLPALAASGLDLVAANATNRIAVLGHAAMSAHAYRRGGVHAGKIVARLLTPALLGSVAGAWAAAQVSERILRGCLLASLATLMVLALLPVAKQRSATSLAELRATPGMLLGFAGIGFYSGFLQVGVGIVVLVYLSRLHGVDLVSANGIKVLLNLGTSTAALLVFVGQRLPIEPLSGLVLSAGSILGGYLGARLALRLGEGFIRALVLLSLVACILQLLLGS